MYEWETNGYMVKITLSAVFLSLLFAVFLFFPLLTTKKPIEKVHAQTPPIIAQDTFQRPNQTYWGTASDGQTWEGDANTNSLFSIYNNTGQKTSDPGAQVGLLGPTISDAQTLVTFYMEQTYVNSNLGTVIRYKGGNFYKALIGETPEKGCPTGYNFMIKKQVNGNCVVLAYQTFNPIVGTFYTIRFQVIGKKLSAKVWQTGTTEPSNWMLTATDATYTSGRVGVRAYSVSPAIAHFASFTSCSGGNCVAPTPTPTPTPSAYSICGTIYNDINKDTYYVSPDTPYNANNTITFSGPTNTTVTTTNSGAYCTGNSLLPGTYTVSYTPPQSYGATYPIPISFLVTVGGFCNSNGYHDANCTNGSITGLDFGITNEFSWFQGVCSDFRQDNGVNDPLPNPAGSGTSCGGVPNSYASVPGSVCSNPGIVFSGDSFSSFGQGQASANPNNWMVGGPSYSENFTPTNKTVIRTSYSYMTTTATQAGIDLTDPTRDVSQYCGMGGLSNCTLSSTLPDNVYVANGNLTLNSYAFPTSKNYVILVNGNLTIAGNILVPTGSTATFSVAGTISVLPSVGESSVTSQDADIQGLYSADNSFLIQSFAASPSQCNSDGTPKDKRLNITGAIVVNAAGTGGTIQNNRDLCQQDLNCPTFTVSLGNGNVSGNNPNAGIGLTYVLNAPKFIKHQNYLWQEVAP